jgi:hypothetical protein
MFGSRDQRKGSAQVGQESWCEGGGTAGAKPAGVSASGNRGVGVTSGERCGRSALTGVVRELARRGRQDQV